MLDIIEAPICELRGNTRMKINERLVKQLMDDLVLLEAEPIIIDADNQVLAGHRLLRRRNGCSIPLLRQLGAVGYLRLRLLSRGRLPV